MSRIRADQLVNRAGSGGPKFPHGVAEGFSVSGVVTATSFTGNLTGNADTATTATTATNAQGLTGTPNITVQNATVQGNLTVNGTTTTIDTAVTAVDSLAVDGSVAIGTDSPSASHNLTVRGSNDTTFTNNPSNIFVAGTDTSGSGNSGAGINFGGRYRDDNGNTTAFAVVSGIKENTTHNNWAGALTFATRENGNAGGNQERLRITSTGKLEVYKGTSATGKTSGSEAFTVGNGAGNKRFSVYPDGTAVIGGQGTIANNNILLQNDGQGTFSNTVRVDHSGNAGSNQLARLGNVNNSGTNSAHLFLANGYYVSPTDVDGTGAAAKILADGTIHDSIGPLRRLGQTITTPNYTLIASDAGKHVRVDSGATITVPDAVFSAGDMITIVANSSNNVPITQGSGLNLYNASDGTTGNKTLAARTVCTILFAEGGSGAKAYISGGGLS